VPWCTHCDRFLSPSTVRVNGTCPTCGQVVDAGRAHPAPPVAAAAAPGPTDPEEAVEPVPWHLKLLLVALAIYLAYRAYQGVAWLLVHL
jgi:hypothetical protein